MSVAAMIRRMGRTISVQRPTTCQREDGTLERCKDPVLTATAFIQPRGAAQQLAQGRDTMRTACIIYLEGSVDIRTDDEIAEPDYGAACSIYRVVGVRVPDLATTHPNAHTIVDAVQVLPTERVWEDA